MLALSLLCMSGCARSHQRCDTCGSDASLDAATRDAAPADAPGRDAPLGPEDAGHDAQAPDGGMLCAGTTDRFGYACVFAATGTLPAGRASTLPVFFERCECRECAASVRGAELSLTTRACDHECAECTFDASCALPPLSAGDYALLIDGAWVGSVRAQPAEPTEIARPRCLARQETDAPLDCQSAPSELLPSADEICMRELIDVGTSARLELRASLPCELATATCAVTLEGSRVLVRPVVSACPAAGCAPGSVVETTVRCVGPPLRDGRYSVEIDLGAGPRTRRLTVRDITSPGDVVCAPPG